MPPIFPFFNRVNCRNGNAKSFCNFGLAYVVFNQKLNRFYRDFIQNAVSVVFSLVSFVSNCIVNVFLWGSIAKIFNFVIVSVGVYMPYYMPIWTRTKECLSNKSMNSFRSLSFISKSFFERNTQVVSCRVLFSDKPLPIFQYRNSAKAANFVDAFISSDWHPNFRRFCHV